MAEQKQAQKTKATQEKKTEQVEEAKVEVDQEAEALKAEIDAFLDEIDEVLEATVGTQNASQFCGDFVQKGGE